MTDDDWARQVRRVRADRAAARRRHPANGRAQSDQPGMLRAVPGQPDDGPPSLAAQDNPGDTMTNPADAYFEAMYDQANRRLGHTIGTIARAVFAADGFGWNRPAVCAAIAARFRDLRDETDLADGITTVICATYADHGFPHDAAAVRQAVTRQLAEGRGTSPQDGRP